MATSIIPALNVAYRGRSILPDGTDLNDVFEHGLYGLSSSYTYSNMPTSTCYELFVGRVGNGTGGIQLAFQHTRVFIRFRSGTAPYWTEWHVFGTDWAVRRPEIVIPANSDFNTYTTPGSYRVASTADMETMTNVPFTSTPCRLDVFQTAGTGTDYVKQICWTYAGEGIYIRTKFSSSWSDWVSLDHPYRYRSKGTLTDANYGGFGWLTTSGTQLSFYMPCVTISGASFSSITSAKIQIRKPTGGYLMSSGFDIAPYITYQAINSQGFYIVAIKSDGFGDVPNNIPLVGAISLTAEIV